MLAFRQREDTMVDQDVLVFCGEDDPAPQPDTFRCCPLGVQFYSKGDVPQFRLMDLNLKVPEGAKDTKLDIRCRGVVVHSQHDRKSDLYRIWVLFVDLKPAVAAKLKCVTKKKNLTCPHCENF
jgi:hypothetical protein